MNIFLQDQSTITAQTVSENGTVTRPNAYSYPITLELQNPLFLFCRLYVNDSPLDFQLGNNRVLWTHENSYYLACAVRNHSRNCWGYRLHAVHEKSGSNLLGISDDLSSIRKKLLCFTTDCETWLMTTDGSEISLRYKFWQYEWYKNNQIVMTRHVNFGKPLNWFRGIFSRGCVTTENSQDCPLLFGIFFLTFLEW